MNNHELYRQFALSFVIDSRSKCRFEMNWDKRDNNHGPGRRSQNNIYKCICVTIVHARPVAALPFWTIIHNRSANCTYIRYTATGRCSLLSQNCRGSKIYTFIFILSFECFHNRNPNSSQESCYVHSIKIRYIYILTMSPSSKLFFFLLLFMHTLPTMCSISNEIVYHLFFHIMNSANFRCVASNIFLTTRWNWAHYKICPSTMHNCLCSMRCEFNNIITIYAQCTCTYIVLSLYFFFRCKYRFHRNHFHAWFASIVKMMPTIYNDITHVWTYMN